MEIIYNKRFLREIKEKKSLRKEGGGGFPEVSILMIKNIIKEFKVKWEE